MSAESRPHPRFLWTEQRVQSLPLSLKRLLEYVWTGPDVNGAGVTVFEPGVWQSRIGEISFAIETGLEMLDKAGHVLYDTTTGEVWPRRWFSFHKFATAPAKSALNAGLRRIQSSLILAAVSEAAAHAGVSVDNFKVNVIKQRGNLPTPTPTPTTTTTTTLSGLWLEAVEVEIENQRKLKGVVSEDGLRNSILKRYADGNKGPGPGVLKQLEARKRAQERRAQPPTPEPARAAPEVVSAHMKGINLLYRPTATAAA
ncbi:MAG: hypothetical protein Q8J72_08900 [Rhodocyclaceae bacterium]|nr:hypothetical protein [Rhodocyclaceae bacterium]